ncbi:hypothetical protein KPL71_023828 [Citrus sinensis]|uniref:Uncharacterized protein n=1 Tax=Citrus sinensis TaxID=2711 RepID=A0ACB8ILM9_CITSI|nr:hypothetical protein KPL71_023828 [Citrus sinensis]
MASTSSSAPVTLSSTLSLPKSCTSHTANKIEKLVEYSYIPESTQISESSYPLISPYQLYKRPSSFTRSIRTLISTRRPHPKEYIQSSRLDQCSLPVTPAEQYVTLEIPSELISNWKREGYTHLHLGGIRLILTLHGRKGLPVTTRIAMHDTRFKQYQDAVIGTVLTTLHAGSVLLTFYPNFNLSLQDTNLPTALKVQVQIQGAEQLSSAKIATLHHQLISNYEQFHNNTAPIQTSESMFERRQDGTVRMTFKPPPSAPQEPHRLSFTYSSMITTVQTAQEDLLITGFNSAGYPIYPAKQNGHFLWDVPSSGMCDPNCPCWDDWEEDDDYAPKRTKKPKKKTPQVPCQHCEPKSPKDPPPRPAPLPIYRKELKWTATHCKSEIPSPLPNPTPIVQPLACMMFSSTSSDYSSSFPPLEPHTDSQRNVVSKPFIPSPITSTGHLEPPKPFESVLNWQTQNARAQNDTLLHLNSKVEKISFRTEPIETKVDSIAAQMQQIHQNLQSKIDNPLPPPPKLKPKSKPQPRPVTFHQSSISIPGHQSSGSTPASPSVPPQTISQPPTQSKDKEPMHQFTAHTVADSSTHSSTIDDQTSDSNLAVSNSRTETDTQSSASTSDSEKSIADITKILMAQPDQPTQGHTSYREPYIDIPSEVEEEMPESSAINQPSPAQAQTNPPSQKSSNGPWFTFDDLPSHKWRDRLTEMSAWIDLQMLRPGATTQSVLREFATRFTGALRDWFDSLGQYRQLPFVDLPEVSSALAVLHNQFLGDPSTVFEAARRDYLNMKCCSLNAKDLDFHYKRMSLLFYKLNGFNEPTLKHVFLASLPEEFQPDIQRQLTASNLALNNISLGKIFQLAKTYLDKLCEQKQFFKKLLKDKEPFRSACKKPYLQIKCKKKKDCDCSPKKKRHVQKFKTPDFSLRRRKSRKPYRFFRKKSSSSREFKRKHSSRCFICKKKGHYAKDCPNKREKSIRLVEHLQATIDYSPDKDELEFYFSKQDAPNDETVFALQNSSDDSDNTGAQRSMLNPHILPPTYWTKSEEHFKAINGKLFTTSLITKKPIGIQIFPNCVIWTKVIGSTLPNKDIFFSLDRVKSMFKPFTDVLKLYNLSETPQSYQDISTKLLSFCPESHSEFTHPSPLWKNKSFFIKLLFKLNEDINPTKATHPGMSPSDLLLAQKECSQLFAQGLIEPTSSQWACQAFYVEKHSEIVRGKKCLVIDYQPLNMFLQDDKFPLPRRQSMFTFLKNAQIFSKFDLKSGFWQLGIKPSERYKTAFCSHDEHRQLLTQFYDIIQSHGIMLSAKKSTIAIDNIEFLGLTLDPSKETTEDVLWPYFQHPDTNLFWTQDQVYEWFTAPHIAVIENEIQSTLHNYLCQLNHQTPPHKDIFHTFLGPQHDLIMIPTPSAISKPKSTGIIIKEERPDYTDFLYQDSQDPWEEFLPLSQHLQQFPQPTMNDPGSSSQPSSSQPSKADKATQMPSPTSQPSPSKLGYRRDFPYPPCRGPQCKHPKLSKTFFPKSNPDNPYDTESSSEDDYMNPHSP